MKLNLSVQIFASLVLSVVVGLVLGDGAIGPVKTWVAPVGTMFINLIKMMIVPVVLCSLVVGMTSMGDLKKLGRIGMKTVGFYMVTTAIAIVIGFAVASVVQPGIGMALPGEAAPKVKEAPTIMQVFVNMIPTNPIASMAKADILPVIIFSLFLGAGIISVGGSRSKLLINLFDAGAEVCYKIIAMIMRLAPIGVFCLLLPVVVQNGPKVLLPLLSVIIAMAVGCTIHAVCVYSSVAAVVGHMSPVRFFRGHGRSHGYCVYYLFFRGHASGEYEEHGRKAGSKTGHRVFRPASRCYHQYGRHRSLHGGMFPFHRQCIRYSSDNGSDDDDRSYRYACLYWYSRRPRRGSDHACHGAPVCRASIGRIGSRGRHRPCSGYVPYHAEYHW